MLGFKRMSVLINMAESILALEDESFYNVTMFYVLEMIYVQTINDGRERKSTSAWIENGANY